MTNFTVPQSRHLATAIPGPKSTALHRDRLAHVTDGFGIVLPVFIQRAEGGILEDVDGNRIIDFSSGIGPTAVGASNPLIQARISEQLERFTHTCFMSTEYESFTQVAQWLNQHTPGDFEKRTALFTTGAEAIENAIKIARSATGRNKVLVFDNAFHGRSLLAMAMTAKENPYKKNFGPFPGDIHRAPVATPLRWDSGPADATAEALEGVERILAEHGATNFAAMVIEPIQGEGGCLIPSAGYLPGLREIADRYGIVLVADEIQAGMGRTGTLFAMEHEGIAADLSVTAKALAGGMPLSAVTGRAEIMNNVHSGGLGGTYAGNPLACAAALGVFEALADGSLLDNARQIESTTRRILSPLMAETDVVVDVRGRGALLAIEFADKTDLKPRPDVAKLVSSRCHEQGVLTLTNGTYGNVIRLLPPLVISQELLEEGLEILRDAVYEIAAGTLPAREQVHA
jgi:4-aminobutyrate aminotransferase/(S)-3-amino-2-methylpropionate transaminase